MDKQTADKQTVDKQTVDRIADLRAAQARLEHLVASTSTVIYAMTVDGDNFTPTWVSENVSRVTGHTVQQALAPTWWMEHLHPDDQNAVFAEMPRLLRENQFSTDYRFRHADGSYRWIHDESRLIRDTAGKPIEVVGTWIDMTERKLAEVATEEARDLAERSSRARAAFLANMSHEIRTPMKAVLGLTELVLDTDLSPYQRRSLGMVRSAGETLLTLLNDILDFSKIEAEHLTLETIPFDLHYLLESTIGLLAVRVSESPIELAADLAPSVPRLVRGDPTRLRQVLTNLVGNAIKFTKKGEIVLSAAEVTTPGHASMIRFAVRDTGIGIAPEQMQSIFEEFMQADSSMTRRYGGTGLGLAIAKRLVTLMGGELAVKSEQHHGSEFSFTIPLPVEQDTQSGQPQRAWSLAGLRMLVVDDNATNRRIVREMLSSRGVTVAEAPSADEGLEAIRLAQRHNHPFALAIIDAQMPDKDGFALGAAVRADPALVGTRLLMLTSAGQRGDLQRCKELGIEGYLSKPVSRTDLLETSAAVLGIGATVASAELVTRHVVAESRRRLRILLAEDNPVNQEVAATMLRKRGHQVTIVPNGREAVEQVETHPFDIVLMDIQMPEMDGFEATQAIRARPASATLPIVALTAHALTGERERCFAKGMNGYVAKPFRAHDLFAAVEGFDLDPVGPAEAPGSTGLPPVDLEGFRRTMREAGAEDAVDGILDTFTRNAVERLEVLSKAVAAGDGSAIATAAHSFTSPAGAIGALRLAGLLQEIERAGKENAIDDARSTLDRVRPETEAVLRQLERERAKRRSPQPA